VKVKKHLIWVFHTEHVTEVKQSFLLHLNTQRHSIFISVFSDELLQDVLLFFSSLSSISKAAGRLCQDLDLLLTNPIST